MEKGRASHTQEMKKSWAEPWQRTQGTQLHDKWWIRHNRDQRVRAKKNLTEKHLHNSLLQLRSHKLNSSTESTIPHHHQLLPAHGVGSFQGTGQQTVPCEQPHRDASPPGAVFWALPKVRRCQQQDLGLDQQGTAIHPNIQSEFQAWLCYTNATSTNTFSSICHS